MAQAARIGICQSAATPAWRINTKSGLIVIIGDVKQANTRFLNALRAIAAIWVMVAHCVLWGGFKFSYPSPQLAVDVFMLLSGYLMALTMRPAVPAGFGSPTRVWLPFYIRRFFRIAPLYYVTLLIAAVNGDWFVQGYQYLFDLNPATFGGPQSGFNPVRTDYSANNLLLHFTFVFGVLPGRVFSTMTGDWSLALEAQFYLLFPLILSIFNRFGSLILALSALAVSSAAWHLFGANFIEPAPLPLLLQYFVAGMLLYRATVMRQDLVFGLVLGMIIFDFRLYGRAIIYLLPFVLTIYILGSPRWFNRRLTLRVRRLLENRLFDVGADLSYGIYLIHGFFISASALTFLQWESFNQLPERGRLLVLVAFVSCGTLIVSFVLHHLVELPGIQAGKFLAASIHKRASRISDETNPAATPVPKQRLPIDPV